MLIKRISSFLTASVTRHAPKPTQIFTALQFVMAHVFLDMWTQAAPHVQIQEITGGQLACSLKIIANPLGAMILHSDAS